MNRKARKLKQRKMKKPVVRENAADREVHHAPCHSCSLAPSCFKEKITCAGFRYYQGEEESDFDRKECVSRIGRDFEDLIYRE